VFEAEILDNTNAERVRKYHGLLDRKQREKTGLMLVEGIHPVEQLLRLRPNYIEHLIIDQALWESEANNEMTKLAQYLSAEIAPFRKSLAARKVVDAISKDAKGVLAVSKTRIEIPQSNQSGPIVILEGIQDPGNAGAIVRASVALGARSCIFTAGSVDHWNPKVVRASVGAVFQTPIASAEKLDDAVQLAKGMGFTVIATSLHGTKATPAVEIRQQLASLKEGGAVNFAWVFGNEARGLTDQQIDLCDACVYIPISGEMESLNLAGAMHIALWESSKL
jgi:TrmH family RNA methyltransferase